MDATTGRSVADAAVMKTAMAAGPDGNNGLPRKIFQDDFRHGKGNALQAAVASIFGLELIDVPNFVELPEGYEIAIERFCRDRSHACFKIKINDDCKVDDKHDGRLCLLRGKSPRGDFGHVVVARRKKVNNETVLNGGEFEMVHDPHPDETFLDEGEPFGWCMFLVPVC
mmetsp:Transcript_16928/g.38828  ORF Transcript_16928/g.38828 Transcript_16928/m.38828 type:complete len:169 (+) Transcript_16928:185-691(+)